MPRTARIATGAQGGGGGWQEGDVPRQGPAPVREGDRGRRGRARQVLISEYQRFAPFANEKDFLLAAFLDAAAGILAAEAYHAATIRTSLFDRDLGDAAAKISNARDALDGPGDDDQGIVLGNQANIVPADNNGICFGRSADRVLNVVYLNPGPVKGGGFFPKGVNGDIVASGGA
ncbi:hypothetical protein [Amycolatopsis coloradensis]|uniref:hypothetical protein n=1 Tax=Amycolatopsis coloradensis TaxID=76021 RepID=UPI0026AC8178